MRSLTVVIAIAFLQSTIGYAQTVATNCPGPIFNEKTVLEIQGGKISADCVPPGPPTGGGPTTPPGPILREVEVLYPNLDFNSYFGVLNGDQVEIKKGTPMLDPSLAEDIELNGFEIEPNAAYILPNKYIADPSLSQSTVIVGGGALAQ
jgi:hypothetical protein